jgi:hypothetical protein
VQAEWSHFPCLLHSIQQAFRSICDWKKREKILRHSIDGFSSLGECIVEKKRENPKAFY